MDKTANGEYDTKLANLRTGETMKDTRKLQGQSPYLVNATLSYSSKKIGTDVNVNYNVQGETLEVVGIAAIPDVYTLPFNSLGINVNKTLGKTKNSSIRLGASNLLNESKVSYYKSYNSRKEIFSKKTPYQAYSLSYTYKF
jgi:hypothetical protein